MDESSVITLSQACEFFRIAPELVKEFADFGLIPLKAVEDGFGIEAADLDRLRIIINLHESLGINKGGIEVILNLRARVARLQEEVEAWRDKAAGSNRFREADEPKKRQGYNALSV